MQAADWKNFPDVREALPRRIGSMDKIVFDIKGNDFRLIATAQFENSMLFIRHVLTHEEYDKGDWRQ